MVDLEGQIRAWVDAEVDGVGAVTVGEVLERGDADAPASRPGRHRVWGVAAAIAVVLAIGGAVMLATRDDGRPDSVQAGPGRTTSTTRPPADGDWKRFTEPNLGWTLERPISSTLQSWEGRCAAVTGSLVTVSGQPRPVEWKQLDTGCTSAWSLEDLRRPGFVALQISHVDVGPYGPDPTRPDTPPGLALGDLQPEGDSDGIVPDTGGVRVVTKPVIIDGDHRYSVTAWIDDDAAPQDLAALRRMVRSVRWDAADESKGSVDANASANPRTSTFVACMRDRGHDAEMVLDPRSHVDGEIGANVAWGDGVQERASYADDFAECSAAGGSAANRYSREFGAWPAHDGPSQLPTDAERDGVIPEVAALPLADRGTAARFVDTDEGTWAFTRADDRFGGAADENGNLGDPAGRFGVDFVNAHDYSEVILVDPDDGSLLRAYPFPGLPLTWMRVGPDAVYAGRVGDGGTPDSVIVRIDRETLEAETVLFPYDDPAGPGRDVANDLGSLDPEAMGWRVATAEEQATTYVGGIDLPGGLLVDGLGVTMIDLAAIEGLFA